jgi:hypothetical protein
MTCILLNEVLSSSNSVDFQILFRIACVLYVQLERLRASNAI